MDARAGDNRGEASTSPLGEWVTDDHAVGLQVERKFSPIGAANTRDARVGPERPRRLDADSQYRDHHHGSLTVPLRDPGATQERLHIPATGA